MTKTKLTLEEQYQRANKAQKRVLIAKDAIKQIEVGRYVAQAGTYFKVITKGIEPTINAGLRDGVTCAVCAKGAIFASKLRCDATVGEITMVRLLNGKECVDPVLDVFNQYQLDKIEAYFEGDGDIEYNWFVKCRDSTKRLLAILRNIIRNKGTFKP